MMNSKKHRFKGRVLKERIVSLYEFEFVMEQELKRVSF